MDFKIVCLGHLGVGSIFGIAPKGKEQNKLQKWLRDEAWEKAKEAIGIPETYPNVLVVGGEVGEGQNRKYYCEDIWLPEPTLQSKAGAELISEWIGPETREILLLYGHQYHGLRDMRFEDLLYRDLKIRWPDKTIRVGTQFIRSYFGKTLRFRHGVSGAFTYLASANERQIKFNLQEYALGKTPRYDANYEFHNHRAAGAVFETIGSYWCPCFKLLDKYGQFTHPEAWLPDIGVLVVSFERRFKEIRINNDLVIFRPPFLFEQLEEAVQDFKDYLQELQQKSYKEQLKLLRK